MKMAKSLGHLMTKTCSFIPSLETSPLVVTIVSNTYESPNSRLGAKLSYFFFSSDLRILQICILTTGMQ